MSELDIKPNRKIDKWEYAIKKAGEFSTNTECKLCPLNQPCRKRVDDDHVWAGGCAAFLLAAVIAGILDLDGNPIEEAEQ